MWAAARVAMALGCATWLCADEYWCVGVPNAPPAAPYYFPPPFPPPRQASEAAWPGPAAAPTWEWRLGLRSSLPAWLYAGFYAGLARLGGLGAWAPLLQHAAPRVGVALLSAAGDGHLARLARRLGGARAGLLAAGLLATNWWLALTAHRPLLNTLGAGSAWT